MMSEVEKSNETEEEKQPEVDLTLLSKEDLLAIITEMVIDKKDLLEKILATDESQGVALNSALKGNYLEVLVGEDIKVCYAKEEIDEYEQVIFLNIGEGDELFVSPLQKYNKSILELLTATDFATETTLLGIKTGTDKLITIAETDFATETTLDELNDKVESVTEGGISKIQTKDDISQNIFELILIELQKMNIQLSLVTDNEIKESDINDD